MAVLRNALSLVLAASLALSGGGFAPAALASAPRAAGEAGRPLAVRIGQANGLTHIDFPGEAPGGVRIDGAVVALRFAHATLSPELARLKFAPTNLVKSAAATPDGGGLRLILTLADGVVVKSGRADGVFALSLWPKPGASAAGAADKDQAPAARPDPVPAGGRVRMQAETQGQTLILRFPWRAPLGAAVFRRGDALWLVFDAKAVIDLSALRGGRPQIGRIDAYQGGDYSAVRILAPPTVLAAPSAQGGVWTLALGPAAGPPSGAVKIGRDDQTGVAALTADVAGATGVFWVTDPAVGDRLAVVTALPPAKGSAIARNFVDATLLPSVQGLALSSAVDDLQVSTDGDVVRISRPKGLALSSDHAAPHAVAAGLGMPQPAPLPALVDFNGWSNLGGGGFIARYDQLQAAAGDEEAKGKAGGVGARLALARFLAGSELSFEALGVLDLAARADQTLMGDAEFRGLRGAARAMAGRYKDAEADFSSPVLADDPASALWRGYVDDKLGDYAGARQQFAAGRRAMPLFAEKWRGRFAEADAEAALGVNDIATAKNEVALAQSLKIDPQDAVRLKLIQARILEAEGQGPAALPLYDQVANDPYGALSAPAALHAVEIRLKQGALKPQDAEATLDSLRFRWRGDATELETVRALGQLYLAQGRYRDALEVLRSANGRLTELPASIAIGADLSNTFKALFLNGGADGLQPIQALALFYDFKDLTPIGADGDQMVRMLAKRLVDVDLLDQAAVLLKYQADNRLDGTPKAEVSTDLAMIDLMDKRPEDALDAINGSRTTLLPTALNARRRLIEARAHMALGRYDAAEELLEGDKSTEAEAIRADLAWRQKQWVKAGPLFEAELGDRWKTPQPLSGLEQGVLVRAGVAYSLAGDDKALGRLRDRYGKLGDQGDAPNVVKVALAGVDGGQLTATDFTRAASDAAVFAGWVSEMKKRFAKEPSPFGGAAAASARPAPPPSATTPAPTTQAKASAKPPQRAPVKRKV
jgi:tetratricopeptide (TPR) repeat protein